jgi:hypothetical protein
MCLRYLSPIPDPIFFHPGSEFFLSIHPIKEFKYFNKLFLSTRKYDLGCSSRIRILSFYPSRIPGSKRHWIPDPDPQHCLFSLPVEFSLYLYPADLCLKMPPIRGHLASLGLIERYLKSILWICIDFNADPAPGVCCKIV